MRSTMQTYGGILLGLVVGIVVLGICWIVEREPQ